MFEVGKMDKSSNLYIIGSIENYPGIVQLVGLIATSFPSIQVRIERLFSASRIIRFNLFAWLKDDLLEVIF